MKEITPASKPLKVWLSLKGRYEDKKFSDGR